MPKPPSLGIVTSSFGMRVHPIDHRYRMHYGEDTIGAGNYAPVTGTVVFAGYDTTGMGFGNTVGIREAANPDRIWWTAHFSRLAVAVGDEVVERTTYTGLLGMTGAATGPHAHQECRVGGVPRPGSGTAINPRPLYVAGGSGGGGGTTPIERDDDMAKNVGFWYKRASDGVTVSVVCNPESGFFTEYQASGEYDNGVALVFGTGSFALLSESHKNLIQRECAEVLASRGASVGSIEVATDPKLLAAVQTLNATTKDGLAAAVAATKALNPPG